MRKSASSIPPNVPPTPGPHVAFLSGWWVDSRHGCVGVAGLCRVLVGTVGGFATWVCWGGRWGWVRWAVMSDLALPDLPPALDALRRHVLEHSVKRGDFTLKSGAKSTWFLDTKQTACRPDGIMLVADAMLDVIPESATAIGGLTMGADPVAFGVR